MDTRLKRYVEYTNRENPADIIDDLFDLPLLHQPGAEWTYSSGITWAGKVVEKLTGQRLDTYMDSNTGSGARRSFPRPTRLSSS